MLWPIFWSVLVICITVYNVYDLKMKYELEKLELEYEKVLSTKT